MKIPVKKSLSVFLAVIVLLSLSFPVFATPNDITKHWAESVIENWYDKGVIAGFPDGSFKPEDEVTRAQLTVVLDNIFKFVDKSDKSFTDVKSTDWFYNAVVKCAAAGIVDGYTDGTFRPGDAVTREQAAKMIANAFYLEATNGNAYKSFTDRYSIEVYAREYVSAVYEAGYITGLPGGYYAPKSNLKRAELMKIVDNILGGIAAQKGTYTQTVNKSFLVNTSDVTLKDMTIPGNLYLAQGIGEGDVKLDGVTVEGRVIVLGGGSNSIVLRNTSVHETMFVYKPNVRIYATGSSSIPSVVLRVGAKLEEEDVTGDGFGNLEVQELRPGEQLTLDGDFDLLDIQSANTGVFLTGGSISRFIVSESAANTIIDLAAGSSVDTFTANSQLTISGSGIIDTLIIFADSVRVETAPINLMVDENIKVNPIIAGKEIPAGTTQEGTGTQPPAGVVDTGTGTTLTVSLDGFKLVDTNNNELGLDVSNVVDGSIRIKGFKAVSNASESVATIESITSDNTGIISLGIERSYTTTTAIIDISDIWPPYLGVRETISIDGLRQAFGSSVTVRVTLKGTGRYASYRPVTKDITIRLSQTNESTLPKVKDWATLSYNEGTNALTATVKQDKKAIKLTDRKDIALQFFFDMANTLAEYTGKTNTGLSNLSISVNGTDWYNNAEDPTQKANLKANLQNSVSGWGLNLDTATLGDLVGKTMKCKYGESSTVYYDILIN